MDVDGLVVRDGDRAAATGRLVRNDLGDWFEPALPVAGPAGLERRIRPVWTGAVRVAGADFGAVAARFEKDGSVEGWNEGDHLTRAAAAAGFDLAAMDKAIEADPDRFEAVIAANEKDHAASGHWGVPTFVFEKEPFFGQDRIDLLTWRMESKGLTRRNGR